MFFGKKRRIESRLFLLRVVADGSTYGSSTPNVGLFCSFVFTLSCRNVEMTVPQIKPT